MQAAFALGVALRVLLALVNTDANDNHLAVVEIIANENRLPERAETFTAYHPPLLRPAALFVRLSGRLLAVKLPMLLEGM